MNNLIVFFSALVISVTLTPLMIRLAPHLGMVDYPNQRKVHLAPIPRVGGIGIVIGSLIPVLLWIPSNRSVHAYVIGAFVILAFGAWDDSRTLGAKTKLVGQIIAAAIVVFYGGIYVPSLPFMNLHQLSEYVAKPFTVFAIIGMINALNVSDGLDGLAGGLSILSLAGVAYLSAEAGGYAAVAIALATLGGVLGFMRYNTHPAKVFMGDAGSQFLGFTLGFVAVFLLQKINTALSPALPLLFLGLPIADLLAVIAQRLYFGISPFLATKHHVHHRLLALNFDHYEAVVIIYAIQTALVVLALLMRYDSDGVILSVYLGISGLLFLFLYASSRKDLRIKHSRSESKLTQAIRMVRNHAYFRVIPARMISVFVPLLFLVVSVTCTSVPRDFAVGAMILAALLAFLLLFSRQRDSIALRAVSYSTAAFVIYLETKSAVRPSSILAAIEIGYFAALAIAIGLAVRYSANVEFRTTPMDYLVILIVLSFGILANHSQSQASIGDMVIKLVIVFYGCEFIISRTKSHWNLLTFSSLLTLSVLGARGFGLV